MKFHANLKSTELVREDEQFTVVSISHETQEAILERHSGYTRIRSPIHELTGEIVRGHTRPLDKNGNQRR